MLPAWSKLVVAATIAAPGEHGIGRLMRRTWRRNGKPTTIGRWGPPTARTPLPAEPPWLAAVLQTITEDSRQRALATNPDYYANLASMMSTAPKYDVSDHALPDPLRDVLRPVGVDAIDPLAVVNAFVELGELVYLFTLGGGEGALFAHEHGILHRLVDLGAELRARGDDVATRVQQQALLEDLRAIYAATDGAWGKRERLDRASQKPRLTSGQQQTMVQQRVDLAQLFKRHQLDRVKGAELTGRDIRERGGPLNAAASVVGAIVKRSGSGLTKERRLMTHLMEYRSQTHKFAMRGKDSATAKEFGRFARAVFLARATANELFPPAVWWWMHVANAQTAGEGNVGEDDALETEAARIDSLCAIVVENYCNGALATTSRVAPPSPG
jgi:hypothetical protein